MTKFIEPWGWSKLDVFRTCKKKFDFQFIQKIPEPGNAAMARGSQMHDDIEAYLNGWSTDVPVGPLTDWKKRFDELRGSNFMAEQAVGLDKNWALLPNWFHKDTWVRAKMDANKLSGDELTVIDFKSGKYRVPHPDQVELYSIVGHAIHPHVRKVHAEFWFIDADDVYNKTFTAAELLELRKKWEAEAAVIYGTEVWAESPSKDCKYCTYSRSKGGKCKY